MSLSLIINVDLLKSIEGHERCRRGEKLPFGQVIENVYENHWQKDQKSDIFKTEKSWELECTARDKSEADVIVLFQIQAAQVSENKDLQGYGEKVRVQLAGLLLY